MRSQTEGERAPLVELMVDGETGDRDGRRAQECGTYGRQARGSARSLRVFDLKAAVTPFSFSSACACTANARMLVLWYTSWLVVCSFLRRSKCDPSARVVPRDRTMSGMPWTDCRAAIGTDARVSDESVSFPRHTPPRAGPRRSPILPSTCTMHTNTQMGPCKCRNLHTRAYGALPRVPGRGVETT